MYWQNPKISLRYQLPRDPILDSTHNDRHILFYDPAISKQKIDSGQTLQELCTWANWLISKYGVDGFVSNPAHHYDIAKLVKLNMWVDNIQKQGIIKPMMLFYKGGDRYGINNGEGRLRALERIPTIQNLIGFISTHRDYAEKFSHLESITTFERFAELCNAVDGQQFEFILTDPGAPYGIFWYEYDSKSTALITPGQSWCVNAMHNYLKQNSNIKFTPNWFDTLVNWDQYKNS
jgi:hypothetical protein